jgi:four helix bundle protein
MEPEPLIPKHGGYRKLKSFQVAQLVYDVTVRFCDRYIEKRSRTHDQMVQAARSGVRNISEGSGAAATSRKSEMKLTNVARASLSDELLRDYESFLTQNGLRVWSKDSREALAMRRSLLGEVDPAVAASLMGLARVLVGQRKLAEGEKMYGEALAIRRKLFSNEHRAVQSSLTRLTDVLQSRGKLHEAEQLLTEFLTPAVQSQPWSAGLLRLRGNLRARLARWKDAAADLSKVVQFAPAEHQSWFQLAPLLIESGDLAGYRQHCHEMLARFGAATDPQIAERIAKASLLLPEMTGEDLATASRMAETVFTADKNSGRLAQYQFTQGLAEYRQDRLDRAEEWAKKALANGAEAAKVCGAGGGGCIAFLCTPGRRPDVERALASEEGVEVLDWKVAKEGLVVTES